MKLQLEITHYLGKNTIVEYVGPSVQIGRDASCELALPGEEYPAVSSKHALIELTPDGAFLRDLESSNGTFVNDQRIETRTRIVQGDFVRLGRDGPYLKLKLLDLSGAIKVGAPQIPKPANDVAVKEAEPASPAIRIIRGAGLSMGHAIAGLATVVLVAAVLGGLVVWIWRGPTETPAKVVQGPPPEIPDKDKTTAINLKTPGNKDDGSNKKSKPVVKIVPEKPKRSAAEEGLEMEKALPTSKLAEFVQLKETDVSYHETLHGIDDKVTYEWNAKPIFGKPRLEKRVDPGIKLKSINGAIINGVIANRLSYRSVDVEVTINARSIRVFDGNITGSVEFGGVEINDVFTMPVPPGGASFQKAYDLRTNVVAKGSGILGALYAARVTGDNRAGSKLEAPPQISVRIVGN